MSGWREIALMLLSAWIGFLLAMIWTYNRLIKGWKHLQHKLHDQYAPPDNALFSVYDVAEAFDVERFAPSLLFKKAPTKDLE